MTDSLLEKQEAPSAQRYPLNAGGNEQIATLKSEGMALMQGNRLQEARELYSNIVGMSPEDVDAWYMLSTIHGKLGRIDDTEACCRRVLALQAEHGDAYVNLGHVYARRGNPHEALKHYQTAVRIKPDFPVAHLNIGNVLNALGKQDEAIASYRQAIHLAPSYADAHNNLGNVYLERDDFSEAFSSYARALELNPLHLAGLNNLAKLCQSTEQIARYFGFYRQAVARIPDPKEARSAFIKVLARMPSADYEPWLDEELQKCLRLNDVDYRPLALVTSHLLKNKYAINCYEDPAGELIQDLIDCIATDDLFSLYIEKVVNVDPDIEALLIRVRRALLFKAEQITNISPQELKVISALAFQCFNNEHIFAVGEDEETRLANLKQLVEQRVAASQPADSRLECMLFIIGMYENLFSLACSERLTAYPLSDWSRQFRAYAEHSLLNYFAEQEIKAKIESIGAIRDQITQLVQSQYEDNPYPRWLSITQKTQINTRQHLRSLLPSINPPQFVDGPIKVLVAGSGTGKHAILAALSYSNAEILAVDISKSSLAYAIRMAEKLNIKNIRFKQADILELSQLETRFHIIECQGVLHHMQDPLKGWRVLTGLLVQDGLMSIGLYSEKARRSVVAARKIIESENISPDEKHIRDFRARILRNEIPALSNAFNNSYDFYTMSACRDLLFHYQEHRFSLPQLNRSINELNLKLLGFMFNDTKVMNMWHQRFPGEHDPTNLRLWDQFETLYPDTFAGMYKFFCQKI
jgi:tetratricopeptide (TPR) repeat protein